MWTFKLYNTLYKILNLCATEGIAAYGFTIMSCVEVYNNRKPSNDNKDSFSSIFKLVGNQYLKFGNSGRSPVNSAIVESPLWKMDTGSSISREEYVTVVKRVVILQLVLLIPGI